MKYFNYSIFVIFATITLMVPEIFTQIFSLSLEISKEVFLTVIVTFIISSVQRLRGKNMKNPSKTTKVKSEKTTKKSTQKFRIKSKFFDISFTNTTEKITKK